MHRYESVMVGSHKHARALATILGGTRIKSVPNPIEDEDNLFYVTLPQPMTSQEVRLSVGCLWHGAAMRGQV